MWVNSNLVEKGDITEGYFNEVISRCNKFRVDRVLKGESEFAWCPSMHRQPTYDKAKSRGYSCLVPKDTCNGISVDDLVNSSLNMHGIKNMEGVLSCHTSYTINSNQCICNIEVTDHLVNLLDNCGCVLTGPVCPLTFKLRSGGGEEAGEDLVQSDCSDPNDVVMLDRVYAGGSVQGDVATDDMLESSVDTVITSKSSTVSEAVNVLLNKFFPGHALVPKSDSASMETKSMDWNVIKNN